MIQNGILNLDKPAGWTSHDVVAKVRYLLKVKKIGHAGTLDPDATGVLVVCVGKATKIVEYLVAGDKEYEAVMRLGETTDTQDASGNCLEKRPWDCIDDDLVVKCFSKFTGEIRQIPPAYSAIKIGGVPSYKLARKGKEVQPPSRQVHIYGIRFIKREGQDIYFRVHCSKGTYIRTLCHDMGNHLGMGAHLCSLRRLRSGKFNIQDSMRLEELAVAVSEGRLEGKIYGMDEVMGDFPSVCIDREAEEKIIHGNPVLLDPGQDHSLLHGSLIRLKNQNGGLLALGVLAGDNINQINIEKVLVQ